MNDRYLTYLAALAQRDRYALILCGFALGALVADWSLSHLPRVRSVYRGVLLALWLGLWVYALVKVML